MRGDAFGAVSGTGCGRRRERHGDLAAVDGVVDATAVAAEGRVVPSHPVEHELQHLDVARHDDLLTVPAGVTNFRRSYVFDVTSLPPGESEFEVRFDVQDAYQSWNDHFGVAVRLRAGEQALAPQAAWRVTRVTPLRH